MLEAELLLDELADRLPAALGRPEAHQAERGADRLGKAGIVAAHHLDRGRVHPARGVHDVDRLNQAFRPHGEQITRVDRRGAPLVALHHLVHLEHAEDACPGRRRASDRRAARPGRRSARPTCGRRTPAPERAGPRPAG